MITWTWQYCFGPTAHRVDRFLLASLQWMIKTISRISSVPLCLHRYKLLEFCLFNEYLPCLSCSDNGRESFFFFNSIFIQIICCFLKGSLAIRNSMFYGNSCYYCLGWGFFPICLVWVFWLFFPLSFTVTQQLWNSLSCITYNCQGCFTHEILNIHRASCCIGKIMEIILHYCSNENNDIIDIKSLIFH